MFQRWFFFIFISFLASESEDGKTWRFSVADDQPAMYIFESIINKGLERLRGASIKPWRHYCIFIISWLCAANPVFHISPISGGWVSRRLRHIVNVLMLIEQEAVDIDAWLSCWDLDWQNPIHREDEQHWGRREDTEGQMYPWLKASMISIDLHGSVFLCWCHWELL